MSEVPPAVPPLPRRPAAPPAGSLALGLALCCALGLLAAWRLEPPDVVAASAPETEFSAARARGYLEGLIAQGGPRMAGSVANARARVYLLDTLRELGLEPQLQERLVVSRRFSCSGAIQNVIAELPGSDPSLPGVLLVAHYDCVGAGEGAGDDGSGVAALLEMVRALKAGPQPTRSVFFLFSDGEESGLLGAEAFAGIYEVRDGPEGQQRIEIEAGHPWIERVGSVINLEARGTRGPSLMFQTGPESAHLVEALARTAPRPVLGSSFSTVYEKLPNDTDLSVFADRGLPGLNFAFIGGVEHYHTAYDDLAHLDLRSLQHHGSNVLPVVRELANAPAEESSARPPLVYFDLLAGAVIRWPASLSLGLSLAALAGLLLAAGLLGRGGHFGWLLARLGWGLLALVLTAVFCVAGGQLAASWSWPAIPFPAEPLPWIALSVALPLALACLAAQLCQRAGFWGAYLVTWLTWSGIACALSASEFVGFSHLFVLPSLAAALGALVAAAAGRERPALASLAALLPLVTAALVLGPLFVLLYQALGLVAFPLPHSVGHPALALYPAVTLLGVLPLLPLLCLRGSGRGALLFTALGLSLLAGLMAPSAALYAQHPARTANPQAQLPGASGDVPYRGNLVFHQSFEDQGAADPPLVDASWHLFPAFSHDPYPEDADESYPRGRGLAPPAFLLSAPRPFSPEPTRPWRGLPPSYRAQGQPLTGAEPPRLEGLEVESHGKGRMVRFTLRSPRRARMLALFFEGSALPTSIKINGKPARVSRRHWCYSAPPEGLRFELYLPSATPASIRIIDANPSLPRSGENLRRLRDTVGSPTTDTADLHIHSATHQL